MGLAMCLKGTDAKPVIVLEILLGSNEKEFMIVSQKAKW